MRLNKSFPHYKQTDSKDCGPTCLKIVSKHYDKTVPIQQLRELSETIRIGSSVLALSEAAEKLGFRTLMQKTDIVYHLRRIKVNHPQRVKLSIAQRMKVNH